MVDSEYVLLKLQNEFPETFHYFSTQYLAFHHTEDGLHAWNSAPVIQLEGKRIKQFRYNEYDLAPLTYLRDVEQFYHHNKILIKLLKEHEFLIKLQVGEMILLDNHRILHGRTAFQGYRNLVGCYVGADDWMMRARAQCTN